MTATSALSSAVVSIPSLLLSVTLLLGCAAYLAWLWPLGALASPPPCGVATWARCSWSAGRATPATGPRRGGSAVQCFSRASLRRQELQLNAARRAEFLRRPGAAPKVSRPHVSVMTLARRPAGSSSLPLPIGVVVFVIARAAQCRRPTPAPTSPCSSPCVAANALTGLIRPQAWRGRARQPGSARPGAEGRPGRASALRHADRIALAASGSLRRPASHGR